MNRMLRVSLGHRWSRRSLVLALVLLCVSAASGLWPAASVTLSPIADAKAQEAPPAAEEPDASASPAKDALRTCTRCHDENDKHPVLSILKSKHAMMADPRTPFADKACVTCHGASEQHMQSPADGQKRASPDMLFKGGKEQTSAGNKVCLTCHESGLRMHWQGSTHDFNDLSCASCHKVHTGNDPVLAKSTQTDVCFTCHKNKRAETLRPFSHPIHDGKMACSDCHNPHGSNGPTLLAKSTINETCYTCHAEKRGPFLWEHAPVREDCTNCHRPHGSVHAAMLKNRPPYLCQQCHLAAQHPSTAYSGTGLPGANIPSGAQQLLGRSCMNCHSQVHGTNHPSGPRKTR